MIALGAVPISKIMLGDNPVAKVMLGDSQIWPTEEPPPVGGEELVIEDATLADVSCITDLIETGVGDNIEMFVTVDTGEDRQMYMEFRTNTFLSRTVIDDSTMVYTFSVDIWSSDGSGFVSMSHTNDATTHPMPAQGERFTVETTTANVDPRLEMAGVSEGATAYMDLTTVSCIEHNDV